ncbi:MAG TPA: hypothetical protein VLA19_13745 [Herpetosiphonaceae bacterium]|nr:hypothetical protein [Herpetosiphonaceae bacterium]
MFKRITSILFVVGLLLTVSPSRAAELVTALPQPKPVSSAWFDTVVAINKQVLSYGQGRVAGDRVHFVAIDARGNSRVEVIAVGDMVYVLMPGQQRWASARASELAGAVEVSAPAAPAIGIDADTPIFLVGDVDVGGAPTTQYQIPLDVSMLTQGNELPGVGFTSAVVDFFIGKTDGYLHKFQVTLRGSDPQLGDIEAEIVTVFSRFNTEVMVSAPPSEMVDPLPPRVAASRYMLAGPQVLPAWARPIFANGLRQMRQAR